MEQGQIGKQEKEDKQQNGMDMLRNVGVAANTNVGNGRLMG